MRILFCDSVIDHKRVEPDYEQEKIAAEKVGFKTSLLSFEEIVKGNFNNALRFVKNENCTEYALYRGWMLTLNQYEQLFKALLHKNIHLITSPKAYEHCHYLPSSYQKIEKYTPKSVWTKQINNEKILSLTKQFNGAPIIVKDFVKSEKHEWEKACFIPNSFDDNKVHEIVRNFLELRGDLLNEGLVFRAFEKLEFLTEHSKSGMPLTKEFRIFFVNNKLTEVFDYWDEGDYGTTIPELSIFIELAKQIESRFFTMDIAKKQEGDWIIMELGDGQIAGLSDNADRTLFYQSLMKELNEIADA